MTNRFMLPFHHIMSTAPGFEATFDNTSTNYALQSTSAREWTGGGSRSVYIMSESGDDFHIAFGTSDITAASGTGMLIPGGVATVVGHPSPVYTHLAVVSSTTITASFTLGYGF